MSGAFAGGSAAPIRRNAAGLGAADWLSLAAAPTFAIMALLTGVPGPGAGHALRGRDDARR